MVKPDYFALGHVNGALRWENAGAFIKSENFNQQGTFDTLLAFVTFNASAAAIDVLRKIRLDNQLVDILIVDNSSSDVHFKALSDEVSHHQNVRLIQTSCNLGGAGGYALINELFLRSKYKYLLLTEDDAVPVELDLVTTLVNSRDRSDMVGCHYYNNNSTSFSFHFTLYSRSLIEKAGIPDPRFFQGGDDAEIRDRHLEALRELGKEIYTIDRGYHHPTLKGMGTPAKVIRSQRNAILADLKNSRILKFLVRVFGLNAYSLFNIFLGRFVAFKVGIISPMLVNKMCHPGCVLFKIKDIHESLDKSLIFESVTTDSIKGDAANLHLASLLKSPLSNFGSRTLIIATLDSPWFVRNLLFARNFIVVKDLSVDMKSASVAVFNPSIGIRLSAFISFFIAVIFLPVTTVLYIFNYRFNYCLAVKE